MAIGEDDCVAWGAVSEIGDAIIGTFVNPALYTRGLVGCGDAKWRVGGEGRFMAPVFLSIA